MTNQEAKFILSAYRPNGADAADAMFSEALKQVQQDPTLAAWFAREQAHDAKMVQKIQEIKAPPGLRDAILTGSRVSGRKRPLWQQPVLVALGAAAAVALVITTAVWPKTASAEDRALATFALQDTAFDKHDGHGEQVKSVQAMLGGPNVRLRDGVAVNFEALRGTGCRTLTMDGQEVFEVCFNRGGSWFHLYAMREKAGSSSGERGKVTVEQKDAFCCASWTDAKSGYRFAVLGSGADAVKDLL